MLSNNQKRWIEPLSLPQEVMQVAIYSLIKLLVQILFRPKLFGLKNIPDGVPVVFIPNHSSYIDAFVLASCLPYKRLRELHWVGWTGIAFTNAFTKGFSRLVQGIPIDPNRYVRSGLHLATEVLHAKQSLVWFPEGRCTTTGELQAFKGGVGFLLEQFPEYIVIPVFLKDTGKALKPGSWWLHPIRLEVYFGEPKTSSTLQNLGTGNLPRERIVSALHDAVWELDPRHHVPYSIDVGNQKRCVDYAWNRIVKSSRRASSRLPR